MKKNYTKEVAQLIDLLGGVDNIASVTHCVSRIRLTMHDMKNVKIEEIETLPSVKGTVQPLGQFHIVIGADVTNFYKALSLKMNFNKNDNKANAHKPPTKWWQKLLQHFAEIFVPIIPALVAGGLILGFRNILEANWSGADSSFVANSQFAAGLNEFLWIPAQAVFWYIPVTISWSIFKKMDGSQVLGIIIGLTLLLPPLVNIYEIAGKVDSLWIFNDAPAFDFGSWKFPWKIQYTGQVIPAIGVAFFGVYLERWMNRITTPVLQQIFVPLVTIIGAFTVGLAIIGPIGYLIGSAISVGLSWALINPVAKYFFGPILGLLYAPIVITGVHTMFNAVMIQNTAQIGGSFIFPLLCMSNIAQGSASLMFTIDNRKDSKIREVGYSATTSAWLGVTEPAMYGINIRFLYPFLAAIIGSAAGSLLITVAGVTSNGIGNGAWLGVLSIQPYSGVSGVNTFIGTGYTWFIIACLITLGTSMSLTWIFGKIPKFTKMREEILKIKAPEILKTVVKKPKKIKVVEK